MLIVYVEYGLSDGLDYFFGGDVVLIECVVECVDIWDVEICLYFGDCIVDLLDVDFIEFVIIDEWVECYVVNDVCGVG